jgi:hypothetical protein
MRARRTKPAGTGPVEPRLGERAEGHEIGSVETRTGRHRLELNLQRRDGLGRPLRNDVHHNKALQAVMPRRKCVLNDRHSVDT